MNVTSETFHVYNLAGGYNGRTRERVTDREFSTVAEAKQWLRDEYAARRIGRGDYVIENQDGIAVA